MIELGTVAQGEQRRRKLGIPGEFEFYKGEWMAAGRDPQLSPTVFLLEQLPGSVLNAHFHAQNQFQIFVNGSGMLGVHPIGPVTVHYANAYTGYGPIKAGDAGLSYFTIRAVCEEGAMFLPESRSQMPKVPRLQESAPPYEPWAAEALKANDQVQLQPLFSCGSARAERLFVPPGIQIEQSVTGEGDLAGAFLFVVAGGMSCQGRDFQRWESVFLSPDESIDLTAGAGGCELLKLTIPVKDMSYLQGTAS